MILKRSLFFILISSLTTACGWREWKAVNGDLKTIYSVEWQDNIQITVSGYFTAERSQQLYYSDFENGTLNSTVTGFDLNQAGSSNSSEFIYSQEHSLTATRSALWRAKSGDAGGLAAINLPDLKNVFVSYDYYPVIVNGSGGSEPKIKLGQLVSAVDYDDSKTPVTGAEWLIDASGEYKVNSYHHSGTDSFTFSQDAGTGASMNGKWNRHVMRSRLNDIGLVNGELYFKEFVNVDGMLGMSLLPSNLPYLSSGVYSPQEWVSDALVNLQDTADNAAYKAFVLPSAKSTTHEVDIWIDNIYINDSEERVEICNAEVYEDCTIHMIQPTVLRTISDVTFSVRIGRLKDLNPADLFIHVFNKDGGHSLKGIPLRPYVK